MTTINRISCMLACGMVLLAGNVSTRADFITTQTQTLPDQPTNFPSLTTPSPVLTFAKFDTQGGTRDLIEVDLSMQGSITSTAHMTFTTGNTTITVSVFDGIVSINAPGDKTMTAVIPGTANGSHMLNFTFSATSDLPPPSSGITQTVSAKSAPMVYSTDPELSLFTGPGTFAIPVSAMAQSSYMSSTGNGIGQATTTAGATVTLTYRAVPEPASFALLGLGLGGVSVVFGRRRSR